MGKVSTYAEKNSAEEAASRSSTSMSLAIARTPATPSQATTIDVKSKIEDAYRRHAQLDADAISVTIKEGALTLSGNVHSILERNIAAAAAWAAPGVRNVENQIRVQP